MMDVLICYEILQREIENISLLQCELKKRGHTCNITAVDSYDYFYKYTKKKNRARVLVVPWLRYNENVYWFLKLTDSNHIILNLRWEQIFNDDYLPFELNSFDSEIKKAYHICWGENSRIQLLNYGIEKDHLPITGAIQMDYGNKLFSEYYMSKAEISEKYSLDANKKWILYISSFGFAEDRNYKEDIEKGFSSYISSQIDLNRESQKLTFDWIEKYLKGNDCEFIYRPHPTELENAGLRKMKETYKNFHVISDHSVKQWAKVCDRVNLWMSTSNAELLSMGINYFVARPVAIPEGLEMESLRFEKSVTEYDDFEKYNNFEEDICMTVEEKLKALQLYYSYEAEKPAYIKVADYIEQLLENRPKCKFKVPLAIKIKCFFRDARRKTREIICHIHRNHSSWGLIKLFESKRETILKFIDRYEKEKAIQESMDNYFNKHIKP